MYNKLLTYLLSYDPKKCVTKPGILFRKAIYPLVKFFLPLHTPTDLIVVRKGKILHEPILFASTHGFKEDIEDALILADRSAFLCIGSLSQVFRSIDGYLSWFAGLILVDRDDKKSRLAAKEKMIRTLKLGGSVILFPEGTWNKSPNLLMNKLFPGIYDIALATGARIVPIATIRAGEKVYGIRDDPLVITKYDRKEGISVLRDTLATLRWELMEKYASANRSDLPTTEVADAAWKEHIDSLMAEVEYYDYDVELHTKFVDKTVTEPAEAFSFIAHLIPSRENAFLFRK